MNMYDLRAASDRRAFGWRAGLASLDPQVVRRAAPIALLCLLAGGAIVWNQFVGLSWQSPTNGQIALIVGAFGSVSLYALMRDAPRLSETGAFLMFYFIYPLFGMRLSYLAATLDYPIVDVQIDRADAALGFHWQAWARFSESHASFLPLQILLYQSHLAQVILLAVIFSFVRPGSRNYEMLFLLILSLLMTILVMALLPTLGPASLAHIVAPHQKIFDLLRSGKYGNLPYTGIVSFPSYHTIMAIVFVYCSRGIKWVFTPFLVWNIAMLFTVPYGGDHYLSDMMAGSAIAGVCIASSRTIYARRSPPASANQDDFFSEEKKQKIFIPGRPRQDPGHGLDHGSGEEAKVFWFFSSEKNISKP